MGIFDKWISKKEYDKVVGERNILRFENEDLKRELKCLQDKLDTVDIRIQKIQSQLNEKQRYIDKYNIAVVKDPEKWAEHQAIDKKSGGKKK